MKQKFIEERVNELENEVKNLKLIVEQLRKPSTVVQEEIDKVEWLRGEIEGVIEFEGQHYKKVDREAREGDVVTFKGAADSLYFDLTIPHKVIDSLTMGPSIGLNGSEKVPVYNKGWYRTPETVDVYEPIQQDVQHQTVPCTAARPAREFLAELISEKSPNQLRAEIIEKAKGFVEKYLRACRSKLALLEGNGLLKKWDMSPKFEVNPEKRAVVALLYRTNGGDLVGKGIAKCDPSDVYNEHIGKAIALGRALGLDVSEFEQAVQPTWIVEGMIAVDSQGDVREVKDGHDHDGYPVVFANDTSSTLKIINDTNAIYGGVE